MAVASVAFDAATEVLMPGSEDEAVAAFGDGADVTVVGGGTIVVPDMTYRRIRPTKALMLGRAGLAGIAKDGARVTIGAMTPVQDARRDAGARSVRVLPTSRTSRSARRAPSAGTSAPARATRRRAAISRARSSRSARRSARLRMARLPRSRSRTSSRKRGERLLLSMSFDEPAAGAFAGLDRPHTHDYTALAVSGARAADGSLRLAATGAGSWGARLPSAEAAAGDPEAAGAAALADVTPHDDALASAWYRTKVLPVLVRRVLTELEEAA